MAPPVKLTPEISAKICDAIRAGNYIETAAAYAGISRDTLYRWLKRGARKASGKFGAFHKDVHQALAASEIRDVALIAKAATDQWQAAAWRLERRYPDRWGRRERHELSAPDGGPIRHAFIDPDKLAEKIAARASTTDASDQAETDSALDEPGGAGDDSKTL